MADDGKKPPRLPVFDGRGGLPVGQSVELGGRLSIGGRINSGIMKNDPAMKLAQRPKAPAGSEVPTMQVKPPEPKGDS